MLLLMLILERKWQVQEDKTGKTEAGVNRTYGLVGSR
jgi:hypothetical protein